MRYEEEKENPKRSAWIEFLDWVKHLLICILIGILLVVFVIQRNVVLGSSMLPTLRDGDQLFVEKVSKYFNGLQFGDVITLSTRDLGLEEEGNNIIKRIVGVPGDCILIEDGRVYRNGEPLDEPYLGENSTTNARVAIYSQVQLGDDEY